MALLKLIERVDFLEATVFGWTLPLGDVQPGTRAHQQNDINPWASALERQKNASDPRIYMKFD
jgi:hypothetical protein